MPAIVDADAHIDISVRDLAPLMPHPWRDHVELGNADYFLPGQLGDERVGGRIQRPAPASLDGPVAAELSIVFPTQLLALSVHPDPRMEAAVAEGYARWATEVYLPAHPEARAMLYLPLSDVGAARRLLGGFGDRPGVVGAFVTNAALLPLYENRYMELYADLEERGLVLGFHPVPMWQERPFDIFDRFLPVWALGYPFIQCVHLMNWVLDGMVERFPRLRCVFYEAGLSWLTFVAHRVDGEYLKRPSEAPLLRERPSHYIRRLYFSTQPLDQAADPRHLAAPVQLVGTSQLVYGSNYPRWDFDRPDVIRRLSFLRPEEQAAILGGNAVRLFNL